jgi:oligoendopeptidase F
MNVHCRLFGTLLFCVTIMAGAASGEEKMSQKTKERSEVDEKHKWKLSDLYSSTAKWEEDLKKLSADVKAFQKCKGRMGKSIKQLAGCLDRQFDLTKRHYRLHIYAMTNHDQDARVSQAQALKSRIQKTGTEVEAALSFVEPEILRIPAKKMKTMLKSKRLKNYRHYLNNITRRRKHILSQKEEELIARAGNLASVPSNVYQAISTLNLPYPEVTLKNGDKVTLTPAMYTSYRAVVDRDDRLKVFQKFFGALKKFRESYAALLSGVVSRDAYYTKVRKYKSDLHSSLDRTNVPTDIYKNMIKQIRAARPLLWRYLKVRKKLLKLPELGYHDLYASIVPAVKMKYSYEKAQEILIEGLAPLGKDYTDILKQAFTQRWSDVYPTKGKRSGAYSAGDAYDVHPYILLNYNDDYESMSTMAHEYGHALHSYLSNKNQPFVLADYPTFVAEVASTVNENLLRLHLYAGEKERNKRLFLLGQHLENFRQTVFRQALFAEFELSIHDLAQQGQALTADKLDQLYLKLLKEYYGEKDGITQIHPLYAVEWAYIPHFYYNFYMFQYTTSFIAATAIAENIYAKNDKARDSYLKMLKSGGSKYPVQLLKIGGVDMSGPEPYKQAFKSMEQSLDEIDKLIGD